MGALGQDLRDALNALRRDVGFTTSTVLTLALGVGVNTTVFAVLRAVVLAPLPYQEPDRLAMIWTDVASVGLREATSSC